ncbi:MAG: hypothetical protein ACD_54C01132G0004 [uncultured bacterium]|nr:MAG: hypothetical protein ACD_54C01132G0004 [uncultured bacterium]
MKVGFCVQRLMLWVMSPVMQILQPIHSRMSSIRPCSIFCGRNGSAIDGRAQPMKSSVPCRTIRAITSGLVNRPTPTTGRLVSSRMPFTRVSCAASSLNRLGPEQSSHVPCARSHRSGRSPFISMNSRNSALEKPSRPICSSRLTRSVSAIVSPTASRMSARTSRAKRERFSRLPPYSSLR